LSRQAQDKHEKTAWDCGTAGPIGSERYVRYMQWAAWSPLFWPIDEGDITTLFWLYPEPFRTALRQSYRLRGALLPYTYTLAWRAASESLPFIRPMWWSYPNASVAPAQARTQYFFGDVLVRPVAEWDGSAVVRNVSLWLPAGEWVSWDGKDRWTGPANISMHAGLAETPVVVPVGVAMPLWPPGRRRAAPNERPTMWLIWAPPPPPVQSHVNDLFTSSSLSSGSAMTGTGHLYQDDGESLDYRSALGQNESVHTWLNYSVGRRTSAGQVLTAHVHQSSGAMSMNKAMMTNSSNSSTILQLRGFHSSSPTKVTVNGIVVLLASSRSFEQAGYWLQPQEGGGAAGEPACTAGSWIVVCPRLLLGSGNSLTITVEWQ
jgi:hypothetical protein